MANKKFSEFTSQTDSANVQFVVGYNGSDNVRISPGNLLGAYLPLAGGTMTGSTIHNDNVKSIYGTSSDGLEIYHDANDSYIKDNGTGVLYIQGSGNVQIEGINGENMAIFNENGSVQLHYDSVQKFQTTTSGVSVDGAVTVKSGNKLILNRPNDGIDCELSTDAGGTLLLNSRNGEGFQFQNGGATFLTLDSSGNVGIGTTAPNHLLEVRGTLDALSVGDDSNTQTYMRFANSRTMVGYTGSDAAIQSGSGRGIRFNVNNDSFNSGTVMRIDSSGNVGIGSTTPTAKLQVVGLAEHADNSAATTAGLTAGAFYRTGDLLKVVH